MFEVRVILRVAGAAPQNRFGAWGARCTTDGFGGQCRHAGPGGVESRVRAFVVERDWERFHSPKKLAMARSVEASELVELFQRLTEEERGRSTTRRAGGCAGARRRALVPGPAFGTASTSTCSRLPSSSWPRTRRSTRGSRPRPVQKVHRRLRGTSPLKGTLPFTGDVPLQRFFPLPSVPPAFDFRCRRGRRFRLRLHRRRALEKPMRHALFLRPDVVDPSGARCAPATRTGTRPGARGRHGPRRTRCRRRTRVSRGRPSIPSRACMRAGCPRAKDCTARSFPLARKYTVSEGRLPAAFWYEILPCRRSRPRSERSRRARQRIFHMSGPVAGERHDPVINRLVVRRDAPKAPGASAAAQAAETQPGMCASTWAWQVPHAP